MGKTTELLLEHKNAPLISVGLPAYNRARYLPALIDCWLAQTYPNFELIISNDASPDDGKTDLICKEYARKDKRIRYIRQEKNRGIIFCFKLLLNEARGEYFIWAEDDDLWHERFLEDCLNVFQRDPKAVMVFADMVDIDNEGKELGHIDATKFMPPQEGLYERLKAFLLFRFSNGKNQLMLGLWKRKVILDDPLFGLREKDDHSPWYFGLDTFFIFRNLSKGPFGFVPQLRFFHRTRMAKEYRSPRPLIPRLLVSLYHRFAKVFASPYFCYTAWHIAQVRELSLWQRSKLLGWNFFVMARLFFIRKI